MTATVNISVRVEAAMAGGVADIARELGDFRLEAGFRGVPPGSEGLLAAEVPGQGWHPADGRMSLPLITVDLARYDDNRNAMFAICDRYGCRIAPHIKTPMSPVFARDMIAHGAWGVSTADLRQAGVMLSHGVERVLIANQIGGRAAVRRLAGLLGRFPGARVALFVDRADFVGDLAAVWAEDPALPAVDLLVEIGCGRGGAASTAAAKAVIDAIAALPDGRIRLAGVAAYEGTANDPDPQKRAAGMDALFARVGEALALARQAVGPERELILSAGGSGFFDHVIARCVPLATADGGTTVLLRSGAAYFSDNGNIRDRLRDIAARDLLDAEARAIVRGAFQPALRLWGEVLTVNDEGLGICGLGLRDVAHDQGLPVPLAVWRGGRRVAEIEGSAETVRLNDQHAFLRSDGFAVRPGDVVEFGIRHPCTTLDKHQLLFGIDPEHRIVAAIRTFFG